ncbi:hypothetical protein TYRP_018071 [Tyrophagus putrescentiae]|nr:hypothetical protein TYRP_018071 [Tyrophagus putrescentiae]
MTASAWSAWWNSKQNSTRNTSSTSSDQHQLLGLSFLSSLSVMNLTGQFRQARAWVRDELRFDDLELEKNKTRSLIAYIGHLMSAYALEKDTLFLRKATEIARLLEPAFFSEHIAADIADSVGNFNSTYSFYDLTHPELTYLANILGPSSAFAAYVTEFQDSLKRLARPVKLVQQLQSSSAAESDSVILLFSKSEGRNGTFSTSSSPRLVDILRDFYYNLLRLYVQSDGYDVQSLEAGGVLPNRLFSRSPNGTYLYVRNNNLKRNETSGVSCSLGAMLALGREAIQAELEKKKFAKVNQTTDDEALQGSVDDNDDDHLLATVYRNQTTRHRHLAEQLTASCQAVAVNVTSLGLLPESWRFQKETRDEIVLDGPVWRSLLTPDLAESLFTLHRLTGRQQYRDWAWTLVQAIEARCRTAEGFYSTVEVEVVNGTKSGNGNGGATILQLTGTIPPTFFSGTLKYLFLVFAGPTENHRLPLRQWTFNRAGNPLPVCGQNSMYSETLCRWQSRKQMHHY